MVAEEDAAFADAPPRRHALHGVLLHQRGARAAQRTVRRDVDALVAAEAHDLVLWQVGVVLDLVDGRDDLRALYEFLEEGDRMVCHTDGFRLGRGLVHALELRPGLRVGPRGVEVAGAVRMFGDQGVRAVGVHGHGPVHLQYVTRTAGQRQEEAQAADGACDSAGLARYRSTWSRPSRCRLWSRHSSTRLW